MVGIRVTWKARACRDPIPVVRSFKRIIVGTNGVATFRWRLDLHRRTSCHRSWSRGGLGLVSHGLAFCAFVVVWKGYTVLEVQLSAASGDFSVSGWLLSRRRMVGDCSSPPDGKPQEATCATVRGKRKAAAVIFAYGTRAQGLWREAILAEHSLAARGQLYWCLNML